MRLLHTKTYTLHTFPSPTPSSHFSSHLSSHLSSTTSSPPSLTPPYAILSHTWSKSELLFSDLVPPESLISATALKPTAWNKVQSACNIARLLAFDYIWIDTLCIDKSSSAELSEAINSMFEWYALAGVCLGYVDDFEMPYRGKRGIVIENDLVRSMAEIGMDEGQGFLESRWFTRGWTLQELIAPGNLIFYDKTWGKIGDRRQLAARIQEGTGIYRGFLGRKEVSEAENLRGLRRDLTAVCVAAKMKWVSKRQTGRPEDMAYCMMGLFNVNMPLLYGEGAEKAFIRLQEEIIKHSFDQTILAWQGPTQRAPLLGVRWEGILSRTPEYFANSHPVQLLRGQPRFDNGGAEPDGLGFEAMLCPVEPLSDRQAESCLLDPPENITRKEENILTYLAILHCCADGNYTRRIALLVYKEKKKQDRYFRAHRSFFVIQIDDDCLEIDRDVCPSIDLAKAEPSHIVLCSPPTESWHSKQGYWPCGYNWRSVWADWRLVDWIECKPTSGGALHPPLPSWLPDGEDLEMSEFVDPMRYKINGILLFERQDQDAFFVVWGSAPSAVDPDAMSMTSMATALTGLTSSSGSTGQWWDSPGGYFCVVVEWEVFKEMPYQKGDIPWLISEWRQPSSKFWDDLLPFCEAALMDVDLSADCLQWVGARNRRTMVSASVSNKTFLGVEGLVVGVLIE